MDQIPLGIMVEDAIALGYEVIVLIVDDEQDDQIWCANTQSYFQDIDPNHGHDMNWISRMEKELEIEGLEKWNEAMEKVHGGPISTIDQIEHEEYHQKRAEEEPHDIWFDPANPDAVVDEDSACYCGWLGIDAPSKEHAPPGCSCYSEEED
tara:strand:+ start:283 stop:735 length:453 start_codon:yes stop_codon:yes gene_type:complete